MPETHDLDRLFDDLATQVARTSSPRGAHQAIRTARRRRTATGLGVAVGAAVLVVGVGTALDAPGLGVPGLGGEQDRAPQVATNEPRLLPLPAPAPLDAEAMDAAASGWLEPGWSEQASLVLTDPPCLGGAGRLPEPTASTSEELRLGRDVGAALTLASFRSATETSTAFEALADPGTCAESVQRVPLADGPVQATVLRVPARQAEPRSAFWVVRSGTELGLLTVNGADAAPSEAVGQQVALAALAAVEAAAPDLGRSG